MMKVDAVVLAGGLNQEHLQQCSNVTLEALIPIGDRIMVDYVIGALKASQVVNKIAVVGPVEELQKIYQEKDLILCPPGKTVINSVLQGLDALQPEGRVLVCTGDIPLINREVVDDFIGKCDREDIDLYYPVVPKEANDAKYPGVQRTYITLREGTFTGGNMFLVNPQIIAACAQKGEQLVRLRKSPLALSRQIGLLFILKFLLKVLSLQETEQRFSQLLGIKGKAVICHYPEVGIDVDKPSDLELVRKVLAS